MEIRTPGEYVAAARAWESIEFVANQVEVGVDCTAEDLAVNLARQAEIERAMDESPFWFDEDGAVILRPARAADA